MEKIKIECTINADLDNVWDKYVSPDDVVKWNAASSDWHTTSAKNDLRVGGKFKYRMEAKDRSAGFDFEGIYDEVDEKRFIKYHLGDERVIEIVFLEIEDKTNIIIEFDPETENPIEMQKNGWQAILDNFKNYVEEN